MTSTSPGEQPPRVIVGQMLGGSWICQTISSVTRLDVPDLLKEHGPRTARQLVDDHGVGAVPGFLERALRALASVGVVSEDADGRFGPTPLSDVLTRSAPESLKSFAELYGDRWWKTWGHLPDALRTGKPQAPADDSWDADDPEHTERFAEAMKSMSVREVVEHADLASARTLVDVGGGFGHLAIALLERHPQLRASVLDLPNVIRSAERHAERDAGKVRARLELVGGDMFAEVPAADVYILKRILHDWDDASCVRVLRNCLERMEPGGRVLCVDAVLPPLGDTGAMMTKFLDLMMMVALPGKERTEAEWRALYAEVGLELASITTIDPNSRESIIEGVARRRPAP